MTEHEQRKHPRVDLSSELVVNLRGWLTRAECVNVSMSGALLEIEVDVEAGDHEVAVGDEGQLSLVHRCGRDRLAVGASFTVVRIEERHSQPGFLRLGIRFTEMDTESSIHLFNLIRMQGG